MTTVSKTARSVASTHGYAPPTPEQHAEIRKVRGIVRWSRRLAVNALGGSPLFAGTPLEGRAYWPAGDGEPSVRGGVQGVLVPVNVFVSDDEISQQRKSAAARFAQEVAAIAAAEKDTRHL